VGEDAVRLTVSVGVALSNDAAADLTGLLKAADQALYRVKEARRNRVVTSSYSEERASLTRSDGPSVQKRPAA
jgi:PleD family two-component response regulator